MAPVAACKMATEIVAKWGPAFTKLALDGDLTDFKALFTSEPVTVVLQNAEGNEAVFTIGDEGEETTMSWQEFYEFSSKDLKDQDYQKTEAQCLGALGDRVLMETGRFNKSGEVYVETYCLLTLNKDGKIIMFESFSDPQATSLFAAAEGSE